MDPRHDAAAATHALAAGFVEAKPFALTTRVILAHPEQAGVLRTPRLSLRLLREGDREQVANLLEASRAHLGGRINVLGATEPGVRAFDRLMVLQEQAERSGSAWRRAIALHDDVAPGPVLGCVQVLNIQRGVTWEGDAGWWVGAIHCNNGVATEAVTAMVRYALAETPRGLGLAHLYAALAPENVASKRVAERAGFVRRNGELTRVEFARGWEEHELWTASRG